MRGARGPLRALGAWLRARVGWRRVALALLGAVTLPPAALAVRAASLPLPEELQDSAELLPSLRFVDGGGRVLREVRRDDGARSLPLTADQQGEWLPKAMIAAEDRRFLQHWGVDPRGVLRAAWTNLRRGGARQGASTLTMQLARALRPHPRNLVGKLDEAALALRIEASLDKPRILLAYLNHAPFGAQLRGAGAAALRVYGKPVAELSAGEAATLAALPKAPGRLLTPTYAERLRQRRDHILRTLHEQGALDDVGLARALAEPLPSGLQGGGFSAPHLVEAVRQGRVGTDMAALAGAREIELGLDSSLQLRVETAVRDAVLSLHDRHVTAAAAVVLENATGQVLAWVGSADFDGPLGQNDGVLAKRQPGSTLKPFLYALALDRGGMAPSSMLPDVPMQFEAEQGVFAPNNYDGRFHGPVRLREALANSYNIPAVWLADRLGPRSLLEQLRRMGFASLTADAEHYGVALALGDGEVSLLELAQAYAALAQGGMWRPARAVARVVDARGQTRRPELAAPQRVMPDDVAAAITDMLADRHARAASFGEHSVLDLPFAVAAKTGTSKGYRDNLTVGYSTQVTVAAWVGNFDGSAMHEVSGITGAGPLFSAVMGAAMETRPAGRFAPPGGRFESREVCTLSGARPGASCPHRQRDYVAANTPSRECSIHVNVEVAADGLRSRPGCPGARSMILEHYDEPYRQWARSAGRPLAPTSASPSCPGAEASDQGPLQVMQPRPGGRYRIDGSRPLSVQALSVQAHGLHAGPVQLWLDGRLVGRGELATLRIPLAPGTHTIALEQQGRRSNEVHFEVLPP